MKSALYERLFLLNQCLERAAEILEQFQQEGILHREYAGHRLRTVEDLRSDISYVLAGLFHQKELDTCVGLAGRETVPENQKQ